MNSYQEIRFLKKKQDILYRYKEKNSNLIRFYILICHVQIQIYIMKIKWIMKRYLKRNGFDQINSSRKQECDNNKSSRTKIMSRMNNTNSHIQTLILMQSERQQFQAEYWMVLNLCGQSTPLSFQDLLPGKSLGEWRKIAGGAYGDVFGLYNENRPIKVLKIVPVNGNNDYFGQRQETLTNVHPEIVASLNLCSLSKNETNRTSGFAQVKSVYFIRGKFPDELRKAYKNFHLGRKMPDFYSAQVSHRQLYIVYDMEYGGYPLLKSLQIRPCQAVSIFRQVAFSLAVAETELEFEHRDLHLCNILIKPTRAKSLTYFISGKNFEIPTVGILATIIDFTFSRLKKGEVILFRNLNEFKFKGETLQHKIYRASKKIINNKWEEYNPYTNILWLYFLISNMINHLKECMDMFTNEKSKTAFRQLITWKYSILKYSSATHFVLGSQDYTVSDNYENIKDLLKSSLSNCSCFFIP
ncbi:serine/threonine-protein kinase haspin-like isoform X1 [Centruroides sculpturatus]|uniref:serine/threonine-protein kinase haspin-like isoform X1 n=2 Tax=Centruroides sculpturatus TaxID=218467 RepID=UPI000C6E8C79|nr:serine/threonine-protein kinase haspin-like isoform X1 [Centruroides sculpturatus]